MENQQEVVIALALAFAGFGIVWLVTFVFLFGTINDNRRVVNRYLQSLEERFKQDREFRSKQHLELIELVMKVSQAHGSPVTILFQPQTKPKEPPN